MGSIADIDKASATITPSNVLLRSQIEICRILRALAGDHCPIFTELGDDKLFVSRILLVEESEDYLVIEYGAEKSLNAAVFDKPALSFESNHRGARVMFRLSGPLDTTTLEGKPAVRFAIPRTLIFAHNWSQRRQAQRIGVPARMFLHCIAKNPDRDWFTSKITDVSQDGLGGMVYDKNVNLKVGTVLKECWINFPGGEPIPVDLIVRNTRTIVQSDGTAYNRTGMRFVQRPEEIQRLINMFWLDLDNLGKQVF